jgi:hypothetical protein
MQQKNSRIVKKILIELAIYFNVDGLQGLAYYLGQPKTRIYAWVRNAKIAETGLILAKDRRINPDWLNTGKGDMLISESDKNYSKINHKIAARIEPGIEERRRHLLRKKYETENEDIRFSMSDDSHSQNNREQPSTDFNTDDVMAMTRGVLLSNTVYKSALVSNIRAFHQAVLMENEMISNAQKMAKLMEENRDIKEMILENRKMIQSLEEKLTGQKRENQA